MGQFTGNTCDIFAYFFATYGIISLVHLNNFEKEVIEMHYDPVTQVYNIFNHVEDLLEYRDMGNCPYSHLQEIPKA